MPTPARLTTRCLGFGPRRPRSCHMGHMNEQENQLPGPLAQRCGGDPRFSPPDGVLRRTVTTWIIPATLGPRTRTSLLTSVPVFYAEAWAAGTAGCPTPATATATAATAAALATPTGGGPRFPLPKAALRGTSARFTSSQRSSLTNW